MAYRALNPERIERTVERLVQRVEQRFPGSGLAGVVRELLGIAHHTAETAIWISRPLIPLRVAIGFLGILMLVGLLVSLRSLQVQMGPPTLPELAQGIESAIGDVVYVAVAVFFLTTIETRIKRRRALRAIHELRSIAHVIDMHQLTKDPEWVLARGPETGLVPPRSMSLFELSRYLDYCSEALSLTGKVAALYVQRFEDSVALDAVNEVEQLTTGLSRKIWQKLTVLYAMPAVAADVTATASGSAPPFTAGTPAGPVTPASR